MESPKPQQPATIPVRKSSARFNDSTQKSNHNQTILRPFSEDVWLSQNGAAPPLVSPKSNARVKTKVSSTSVAQSQPQARENPRMNSGKAMSTTAGEGTVSTMLNGINGDGSQAKTSSQQKPTSVPYETPSHLQQTSIPNRLIYEPSPAGLWTSHKETILLSPYTYMHEHPGKDIRKQMISAFNAFLRVPPHALDIITRAIGMLHTSSLLVDDVEDSSILRRGVPVAHSIFGVPQTLNSANYVYFLALSTVMELKNAKAIEIFAEEMVNLHRGQGMDLWWRDSLTCPTEEEYLEMVSNKTGGLFRLAVKLMLAESQWGKEVGTETSQPVDAPSQNGTPRRPAKDKENEILIPLVNTIGLLFQILDDYRNLSSGIYTTNKGLAEDLTEGKFSFPIIHAIRSSASSSSSNTSHAPPVAPAYTSLNGTHPSSPPLASATTTPASTDQAPRTNNVLLNILRQKTTDDQVKRYALRHMEEVTGSFAYTRGVLRELEGRAVRLLDALDRCEDEDDAVNGDGDGGREVQGERRSRGLRVILKKLSVDGEEDGGEPSVEASRSKEER